MAVDEKKPFILTGQDVYDYDAAQKAKAAGGADAAAAQTAIDNMEKRGLAQGRQAQLRSDYNSQRAIEAENERQRRADLSASWQGSPARTPAEAADRYNKLNLPAQSDWIAEAKRQQAEADAKATELRNKHQGWSSTAIAAFSIYNDNPKSENAKAALSTALKKIGDGFGRERGVVFDPTSTTVTEENGEQVATLTWKKQDGTTVSKKLSASQLQNAYKDANVKSDVLMGAIGQMVEYAGGLEKMGPEQQARIDKLIAEAGKTRAETLEILRRGNAPAQAENDPYFGYGNQKDYNNAVSTEQSKIWAYYQSTGQTDKTPEDAEAAARALVQSRQINTAKQGGVAQSREGVAQSADEVKDALGLGKQNNVGANDGNANVEESGKRGASLPSSITNSKPNGDKSADATNVSVANGQMYDENGNFVSRYPGNAKQAEKPEEESTAEALPSNDPNAKIEFKGRYTHSKAEAKAALDALSDAANTSEPEYDEKIGGYKPVTFHAPKELVGVFDRMLGAGERLADGTANYTISDDNWGRLQEYLHGEETTEPQAAPEEYDNDRSKTVSHVAPKKPGTETAAETNVEPANTAITEQQPDQAGEPSWKKWARDTGPGAKVDVDATRENFRKADEQRAAERREARKTEFSKLGDDKLDEQFDVLYAEDMDDAGREEFLAAGTGNRGRWLVSDVNELEPYYKVVFDANAREADKARARQKIATMTAFDLKSGYMTKDILKKLEKMMAKKYANGRKG